MLLILTRNFGERTFTSLQINKKQFIPIWKAMHAILCPTSRWSHLWAIY